MLRQPLRERLVGPWRRRSNGRLEEYSSGGGLAAQLALAAALMEADGLSADPDVVTWMNTAESGDRPVALAGQNSGLEAVWCCRSRSSLGSGLEALLG